MNIIGIDVHKEKCEISRINKNGREVDHLILNTSLYGLIYYVNQVKSKLNDQVHVVFEESELAGWLYRGLKPYVHKMISADPKRNALIYKQGNKSDVLGPMQLAQLYKGGFINPVNHTDNNYRAELKEIVYTYHKVTKDVTCYKARIKSFYRINGVMVKGGQTTKGYKNAKYKCSNPHQNL